MPKVTTRSLYPECIANLMLPIDAFYRESRSGVNIAKRYITTGLFGLLRRIPDKNDRCAFTRGSRGEVMIFFEKNKVLGVEPNRVLNILEGI